MFPGMNKKAVEAAMKKLGMKQQSIDALEVIIKTPEKEIVISEPQVTMIELMGQETFQVAGNVSERNPKKEADIRTVSEQAGVSLEEAEKALEESNDDLAEAIMKLKKSG